MQSLSLAELEADILAFDRAVVATEGIDVFCSSSDWILPAHYGLMRPREPVIARQDELWFAGAVRRLEDGVRLLEPLEASWALASALVGARGSEDAGVTASWLSRRDDWDVMLVAGLIAGQPPTRPILQELSRHFHLRVSTETPRYIAEIGGGLDDYLARRSKNFRRSVKKARRRCREAGVNIVRCDATGVTEGQEIFERILSVERRSWKGKERAGIESGSMREFYRLMSARLADAGRHRCWFARQGERDIAYVLGGVRGSLYRGLQFSYDDDFGHLSLGNVLQIEQMAELVSEGISRYDLGSDAHYKHRWADRIDRSPVLFAFRG